MTRCIAEHTPNGPQGYNSGTLITQSPGWIVMFRERLDTRIIPLDKRPHVGEHIRQWNGDSRGWWEGSTLVVETTNFTEQADHRRRRGVDHPDRNPLQGNIHLVERWVPVSATRMHYYATITDPTVWTRPWTFMLPWEQDDTYQLYEFACHEANISIGNSLRGQRLLDKKADRRSREGRAADRSNVGRARRSDRGGQFERSWESRRRSSSTALVGRIKPSAVLSCCTCSLPRTR